MFFRSLVASIALATTLFIALFGVCTPGSMHTMSSPIGTNLLVQDCMGHPAACPMRFMDHFAFLNTFLPRLNSGVLEIFFALVILVVSYAVWRRSEARKKLFLLATLFREKRKRYVISFLQWMFRSGLLLAFRSGILHPKKDAA